MQNSSPASASTYGKAISTRSWGPNGAGKSTLAYAVMGLEGCRQFEGDIVFDGDSLKELRVDERARAGITPAWQEPARYEGLTVRQFLAAVGGRRNPDFEGEALSAAGLDPPACLPRAVDKTLSGGERKKVELASILAMRPRLVLDIDLTDDPCHGHQQLALFNGFYGQYMCLPNLVFERTTGLLLGVRLRRGNADAAHRVDPKNPAYLAWTRQAKGHLRPATSGPAEDATGPDRRAPRPELRQVNPLN